MAAAKDQLLDAIRSLMAAHSPPLHALVVPSEDAHQVRPYLTLPPPPPPSRGGGGRSPAGVGLYGLAYGFVGFDPLVPWTNRGCGLFVCACRASTCRSRTSGGSSSPGSLGALVRAELIP